MALVVLIFKFNFHYLKLFVWIRFYYSSYKYPLEYSLKRYYTKTQCLKVCVLKLDCTLFVNKFKQNLYTLLLNGCYNTNKKNKKGI